MKKTNKEGVQEAQLQQFREGNCYRAYDFLGAHPAKRSGKEGYHFAVWAPYAQSVSVVCDLNNWDESANAMMPTEAGIWETFIPGAYDGMCYKYHIINALGDEVLKCDPYGFSSEMRPHNASLTARLDTFQWKDTKWMNKRAKTAPYDQPMSIYEVHLGSWRRKHEMNEAGEQKFYGFREIADLLVPYLKKMEYTHIELMPISEHPYDASWGYQVVGHYAVTGRYGSPEDFMYFVDKMHENDIGVIIDWVPAHFPRDAHGLSTFDGTHLYEYQDARIGEHKEWGTLVFDYGKNEVVSYLLSNAYFWFDIYHVDGLRVDAVSSMLYLDYSRRDGEWIPNKYGGRENLEAIKLLQTVNKTVFADFPNILMVAEESTAWPLVTKPVDIGGLGFNYKWNMGWMNDVLRYMATDPIDRKYCHQMLTFSMMYAFAENYILPLSHDEVVYGKASMLNKMFGEYEEKFAGLRAFYTFMMAHPGKKLMFMGDEYGQFDEWKFDHELDWMVLEYDSHKRMQKFTKMLNAFYTQHNAMWQVEDSWDGFQWINPNDADHNVISFLRYGQKPASSVMCLCNFANREWTYYRVGVPQAGEYVITLNSDDKAYGGKGIIRKKTYKTEATPWDGFEQSIVVKLPPLSAMYLEHQAAAAKKPAAKKSTAKKPAAKKTTSKAAETKPAKAATKKTAKKPAAKPASSKKAETKAADKKAKPAKEPVTQPAAVKPEIKPEALKPEPLQPKLTESVAATSKGAAEKEEAKPVEAKPAKKTASKSAVGKKPAAKAKPKPETKAEKKAASKKKSEK